MAAAGEQLSEDQYIRNLYDLVFNRIYRGDELTMCQAIDRFRDAFDGRTETTFNNVDLSRIENACAYVFRYAASIACCARWAIINRALDEARQRDVPQLYDKLTSAPLQLKVASLGGGPATDAVAFCSAVSPIFNGKNLEITVADSIAGWFIFVEAAEELLRGGGFGGASYLFSGGRASLNFRQCTLHENDLAWLKEYDVILIVKLISIMEDGCRRNFLQVRFYLFVYFIVNYKQESFNYLRLSEIYCYEFKKSEVVNNVFGCGLRYFSQMGADYNSARVGLNPIPARVPHRSDYTRREPANFN